MPARNGRHNKSIHGGLPDPLVANTLERLVDNAYMARTELFKQLFDPRRSIEDECGYPRLEQTVPADKYQQLYDRDAIGARVVQVLPKESWQTQPTVYEDEDSDTVTEFEEAWDELGRYLRGENSKYKSEESSPIWEYLLRADIISGIGQYGVILLGLDDGKDLREEAKKAEHLMYLRVFPEILSQITRFDQDPKSPRFGKPLEYNLTFNDPRAGSGVQANLPTGSMPCHWSRVIHIAETIGNSSEVYGVPRMRPVLNRLLDLQKVYAADAEAYWKNVVMRIFLESHPQLGGDVEVDVSALRDMMENMENGLQRWAYLAGMGAKTVAPAVVDPTPHVAVQIEAICIQLGIPIRVFKGSERGELASSQDDAAWNDRLRQRQRDYITPKIIVPFVDRLIELGVLPEPEEYYCEWPDLTSQTEQEKANIAATRTQAYAAYVGGQVEALIPPLDYLTREMGYTEDEAESILESAAEAQEEQLQEQQALADDMGFEPAPPPGFQSPEAENPFAKKEVENVFCPTGEGGGVDPSCSPSSITSRIEDFLGPSGEAPEKIGERRKKVSFQDLDKIAGDLGKLSSKDIDAIGEKIGTPVKYLRSRTEKVERLRTWLRGIKVSEEHSSFKINEAIEDEGP